MKAHLQRDVPYQGKSMEMLTLQNITRLHDLEKELFKASQTEREKISRELHDDLSQRISAVRMLPGSIPHAQPDHENARSLPAFRKFWIMPIKPPGTLHTD